MSKYKAGDKVVIRKDLVAGECYGNWYWSNGKEYMKDEDYVVIERVDDDGDYWFNNECFITEEMIEGLYEEVPYKELVLKFHKMMKTLGKSDTEITKSLEEINTKIKSEIEEVAMKTKVKYKIGDKVVINKDLVVGEWYGNWCWSDGKEYMKDKDYVVIDEVYDLKYQVENGKIISHEMIDGLYKPYIEIIKTVILRNGTTFECKAKDLLVVDDMKCVKDNIKKYPDSVVILSSEILVIK